MKNYRRYSFCFLLLGFSLFVFILNVPAFAYEWKVSIIPASLNSDNTIRLVGGEVQDIEFALQADKDVTKTSEKHNISLEWDLPPGMNIVGNGGVFTLSDPTTEMNNDRPHINFKAQVSNSSILGAPGARLGSEWKNHSLFVSAPKSIPAGQDYLQLKLTDGDYSKTFRWPIKIESLTPPALQPKHTTLGFWDYNYSNATSAAAAAGVAKLFSDSGITFTESAGNTTYRKALQSQGIVTGGYTFEGLFFDKRYPDYNAAGVAGTGGFCDPQAIINLPQDTTIPGVSQMVAEAKAGDGIATFDYEPHGLSGFSPISIATFEKKYNVDAADFQTFREYVEKNKLKTFQSTDPLITKLWRQWTEFRSNQTSNYIRRISEAFKAQMPDGRIAITPSNKYGADSPGTLALGCDNAAMAQYADIVLPQIYCGYNGAAAKLAMQMTAGWRDEILQEKAKTKLWPLLLVRYAGASIGNSPQNLRQQIIGCLANGADGITLYYPGMMDASYWEMIARASEDIAKYENFYHDGTRVDNKFPLSGMPQGSAQIAMYPNYQETVQNPGWDFTAHQLDGKVLLTMINLQSDKDQIFDVNIGKSKVLSSQNAVNSGQHQWQVAPGEIAFVMLSK